MAQVFVSADARRRASWLAAFPEMVSGSLDRVPAGEGPVWALLPQGVGVDILVAQLRRQINGRVLVILADEPSEEGAMTALAAGAAGYCNGHAAPAVLQQVAVAVENGGIWVGQGLMQRLLAATARVLPPVEAAGASWRDRLTARELEAAQLLAKGLSNKEIARQLDITERTVKAHVGAMLEKLGARDRLQLSLILNGIEKPR